MYLQDMPMDINPYNPDHPDNPRHGGVKAASRESLEASIPSLNPTTTPYPSPSSLSTGALCHLCLKRGGE